MTYGVQPSGFVAKPFEQVQSELESDFRATFGEGLNLLPSSAAGHLVGIMADRIVDLWQLAEGVYDAVFPDGAQGVSLDYVSAITGTRREPPKLTHVLATCTGTPGTVLEAGRVVSVGGGARFASLDSATIGPGGSVVVEFAAVEPGATPAYASTLARIETPVAGWASVSNAADHFILGAALESDPDLRLRRESELRAQGSAALAPLRERVVLVEGVVDAYVFENTSDVTNSDGVPAHAIEVLVDGGDANAIRAAVFAAKSGGIATHGSTAGTVVDSQGTAHTVKFTRPAYLDVWVTVTVAEVDAETLPADAAAQIKKAVVDFGQARYRVGSDVIASALGAQCFKVSGVLDVASVRIGLAPSPASSATIAAGLRQKPRLDTARVVVVMP
jgi:uncharacterized phage protein gp47/JayE